MSEPEFRWMPHHEGAVPEAGQGKRISTYTIALEGWRRGLGLEFYSIIESKSDLKVRYALSNGEKKHHFQLSMGDEVSKEAFEICDNKELTKKHLKEHNIPVPIGTVFTDQTPHSDLVMYANEIGYPVVLKPTDGNAGKGVFADINSNEDLIEIFEHVTKDLNFKEIIVEKFISGNEYRIMVVGGRVIGSMIRRPASVLGDGEKTISELIKEKNKIRSANPHLTSRLIRIDREILDLLHRHGYSLNSIPLKDERVYLRVKSNLSAGGDAIDTTEQLTPGIKEIAVNVGKAIPNLPHYGVDMIVDLKQNKGVILEVNARPGLGGHMFPMEGKPRDLAKEIIDYYFPETKTVNRSPLFFDFTSILEPIKTRQIDSAKLTMAPVGEMVGKEMVVHGNVQKVKYRAFVRKEALNLGIHGTAENMDDGTVRIRAFASSEKKMEKFIKRCEKGSPLSEVDYIDYYEWTKPLRIGFEVVSPLKYKSLSELKKIEVEKERLEREKERAIQKYERLINRKTWRYTEPLRKILKTVKGEKSSLAPKKKLDI